MNRRAQHQHHHPVPNYNRAFALGVALNLAFVVVEAGFGFAAQSLALLTDAGHNLGDVLGLLLAWGANALANRQPSMRHTYGYSRATIFAGLLSGLLLLAAVGAIAWEALGRLLEPAEPAGLTIMVVAAIGVVINTFTALLFVSGKDRDLNIRGAFLHMAADAAVSLGVVLSGALILWLGWNWVDPVVSLLIAAAILASTWGLLRDSAQLAVDAVPPHIEPVRVREYLEALPGVRDLHDLHIWAMSTTETAMTAHLVMEPMPDSDRFLNDVAQELHNRFEIHHATIQLERGEDGVQCMQSLRCAH
jgi:cobalt-zinc-cadmium efflux system protein